MFTDISKSFYQKVYGKGLWDEPMLTFFPLVKKYLVDHDRSKRILDAACGFNNEYIAKLLKEDHIKKENLIGMDIDESVHEKNSLHSDIIIQDMHEPFNMEGLGGMISLYTWEHLHAPEKVLKNAYDALENNGVLIIIAPQRYYYISTIERMLPPKLKNLAWKLLKSRDVMPYPAFFELCTHSSLKNAGEKQGFEMLEYTALEVAPTWFKTIPPLFMIMCLWMSIVNKVSFLRGLRSVFICVLAKRN